MVTTCGLDHLHGALGHVLQEDLVGVLPRALGNLEDDRGPAVDAALDDGLQLLHVVEVVGGDGVLACHCLAEHFSGVHETELLVADH